MKNNLLQYPYPVLSETSKDFVDSEFKVNLVSIDEKERDVLVLKMNYNLKSEGLKNLIKTGKAMVIARITCKRTSYRDYLKLENEEVETVLKITKYKVCDEIEIEPWIVAAQNLDNYQLKEFNQNYFSGLKFQLKKGAILATAPGYRIKLDSFVEKALKGIVNIVPHNEISSLKVNYAKVNEENTELSDYITILLPPDERQKYIEIRGNRFNSNNIDKFLQSSLVLPAIAGGIELLYKEEQLTDEEPEYRGTVWAESIYAALKRKGYDEIGQYLEQDIFPRPTVFDLTNMLYGNIEGDSLNQLQQKLREWSTLPEEREGL